LNRHGGREAHQIERPADTITRMPDDASAVDDKSNDQLACAQPFCHRVRGRIRKITGPTGAGPPGAFVHEYECWPLKN
jgi:hypothetical protein